jgi:hypothetical protein
LYTVRPITEEFDKVPFDCCFQCYTKGYQHQKTFLAQRAKKKKNVDHSNLETFVNVRHLYFVAKKSQ